MGRAFRWTDKRVNDLCESVADGFSFRDCDAMLGCDRGESARQFGLLNRAWVEREEEAKATLAAGGSVDYCEGDTLLRRLTPALAAQFARMAANRGLGGGKVA
jgi:hypothetical protein